MAWKLPDGFSGRERLCLKTGKKAIFGQYTQKKQIIVMGRAIKTKDYIYNIYTDIVRSIILLLFLFFLNKNNNFYF